jgi:predicted enzyme related to lactoylglutathione lyase
VATPNVDHATAFGRIAFSIATSELEDLEKSVKDAGGKILTPLVPIL